MMEDFSIGSILSGIVASVIFSFCSYIFVKKQLKKKQSINIIDAEVRGNVEQDIDDNDLQAESAQSLKLKRSTVLGSVKQTNKKKQ
ncbi:hypothetical protein [Vibrio sp. 10N.261.46.A3]|uniref:hypothetical protein n=1 Tax=Vibrio sp. 10N.261.46.A3 TaxID=3229658 RepID=UPI0035511FFE